MDPKKASDETMELNDKCGRRDRRCEMVAAGGATHTPVEVRFVRTRRAGEKKIWERPFFAGDGVVVGGVGQGKMDGAEGARIFNELYHLVVTCKQPLGAEGARQSRAKSERGTVGLRFRTGAEEEETDEEDEGRVNHVAAKGLGGSKEGR